MNYKSRKALTTNHNRDRSSRTGQRGFTLIEVMIAIVIFSLGVMAAASAQMDTATRTGVLQKASMATECAAETMERLFLLNFNHGDLTAGTHAPGDIVNGLDGNDAVPVISQYNSVFTSIEWWVADRDLDAPADGIIDAKVITVTVTWGNDNKRIVLTGLKTRSV